MPEYKVETFTLPLNVDISDFNRAIEDKISEYVQNGYRVFSHQIAMSQDNITTQLVFLKED